MQKTVLSLAAGLLALAAIGAHAQTLWKWRDAAGQLHISDTAPPPGTPARNIISGPGGLPPVAMTPKAASDAEAPQAAASAGESALDKKKKAAEKQKADAEKAEHDAVEARNAAIRKDNCAHAQSSLQELQSGQRVARMNANGEREFLDDAQRAAETKRVQDAVTSNCSAAAH